MNIRKLLIQIRCITFLLLPNIHKRLSNVPVRSVISNCKTPTEKVSEFLDFQLKLVMQSSKSCVKDSGYFKRKIKDIQYIPSNSILVTADVVQVPTILNLNLLKLFQIKEKTKIYQLPDLIKLPEFVLRNNHFEFNGNVKKQISGAAIGTKYIPTYACIYMDEF